jgi:hypothetical protein
VGGDVEDVEEEEGGAGVVEGEGEGEGESSGLKVLLVVSGWVDYILHGGKGCVVAVSYIGSDHGSCGKDGTIVFLPMGRS